MVQTVKLWISFLISVQRAITITATIKQTIKINNIMPAKHHIDTEMHLIITTWEGDAIDADFISAYKNISEKNSKQP